MRPSTIKASAQRDAMPAGEYARQWRVRPEASRVGFRVRKMRMYFVRGRFRRAEGGVELGPDGAPESGWLKLDAASISTRMPPRDRHLRSRDFLDVARHPEIVVRADRVSAGENGGFYVEAIVSMKGIERRVPLQGHLERGDSELRQLHLHGRFDRHDFGIMPRRPFEWVVGREVELEVMLVLESARR